jgi:hypothetical protein
MFSSRAKSGNLNAGSLAGLLTGEAASLKGLLPAGMGDLLSSLSGMGGAASHVASGAHAAVTPPVDKGVNLMVPIVLGAALLGGLYWFMTSRTPATPAVEETAAKVAETATTAVLSRYGQFHLGFVGRTL